MPTTQQIWILFAFACCLLGLCFAGVPRSNYEAIMKSQSSDELGLYNSTDKVKILTDANFNDEVRSRNRSILVEFYNSYCGHCRKFAPTYKRLAEEIYGWRDILPVAALDCAADENNGICRDYEIMGYPTLRYFGPDYTPAEGSYGKPINTQNLDEIRSNLSVLIAAENKTSAMTSWPDLRPLSKNPESLIKDLNRNIRYVIVVYEPENSTVGIETALYFTRWPMIEVKRSSDLDLLQNYQLNGSKTKIATISREGSIVPYTPLHDSSKSHIDIVESFLGSQSITEKPDLQQKTSEGHFSTTIKSHEELDKIIEEVKRNKHLVYQADLEMAIRGILHNEIPKTANISGEKLLALQRFLAVLDHYNPLSPQGRSMISQLHDYVMRHNQEVHGEDFEQELKRLEKQLYPVFSSSHYVGCVGSQGYRGYTCSLWTLFHFMTVQATSIDKSEDPLEVLTAIHGYVKYFFGCTHCSEHFQAMATKRKIWNVPSKDEAVLWLWAAHNEVNQRLAGDATEDPKFPKIQFPTNLSCSQCYKDNATRRSSSQEDLKWDKTYVLQFLKNIHKPDYVSRFGVDDVEILHPTLEKLRQKRQLSNVFSDMDMRMGMLLYGFCIVMLVVAFKLFVSKGVGYRKKPYGHDMLGKV